MYHPWRELRSLAHLLLHLRPLPTGVLAGTNGERIWITTGLTQVERRCALAHELEHLRRRHSECQPEAVEKKVRRTVAHRLVPDIHHLATTLVWARSLDEAADHLWVTTEVLHDRLDSLHPAERAIVKARLQETEGGV